MITFEELLEDSGVTKNVTEVLSRWTPWSSNQKYGLGQYMRAKETFFEDFGRNLMVEAPIDGSISGLMKTEMMHDFLKRTSDYIDRPEFKDFVIKNGVKGFIDNITTIPYEFWSDGVLVKIPKGMRLSRAVKFFTNYTSSVQVELSRIHQRVNFTGNLRLSVHPLDFLSMSMNKHGWSSCQSLDGEFAAGTLALMEDYTTVVAYVCSKELDNIFEFSDHYSDKILWNSKKWRVLVHIDHKRNVFGISRHYPFHSEKIESALVKMIGKIYGKNYVEIPSDGNTKKQYFGRGKGSANYLDVLNSGYGTIYTSTEDSDYDRIIIGRAVDCFVCGSSPIDRAGEFICESCGEPDESFCEDCGCVVDCDESCCDDCWGERNA